MTEKSWITGCNLIVNFLNERADSEMANAVIQSGDRNILRNYFNFINQDKNYFEITSYEQLEKFEQIRENACNQILNNPEEVEGLSSYLEYMSSLDRFKFATIEKNFGISLSQAKLLCQKYAFNIENAQEIVGNENVHEMLKKLSQIISSESKEQISQIDLSNIEIGRFIDLDGKIRESFAQMYNESFYEPKSADVVEVVEINDKTVPIYNAGTKFNFCAHVVGFATNIDDEEFNYQKKWNSPTRANHVICTRMVSNECLETADENCVCYGFTDFDTMSLIASAPWNMNTLQETSKFDTVGEMDESRLMNVSQGAGSRFLTPMEQANNTGIDRNETNWDRFDKDGNRKQPSYIIYIAESLSENRYKTDSVYQKSLLVASQYGIPLVLVDRERVIENEHSEIEDMIKKYEETRNPILINRIIQKFENNRTTGNGQSFENTYKTQFPTKSNNQYLSLEELIGRLIDISKDSENPVQQYQQIINELLTQTIRNADEQIELCDIIYRISELDPKLTVDMNKALQNKLGITQKDVRPN